MRFLFLRSTLWAEHHGELTERQHQIPISCISRKVTTSDFRDFDYIIAMDESKCVNTPSRARKDSERVLLMVDQSP